MAASEGFLKQNKIKEILQACTVNPRDLQKIETVDTLSATTCEKELPKSTDGLPENSPKHSYKKRTFPWNYSDFLSRVSTYTSVLWTPKQLSPMKCSRYGWKNAGHDLLQCTSCQEYLVVAMPNIKDVNKYLQRAKELEHKIEESHNKFCPWISNPSPVDFLDVPLPVQTLLPDFESDVTDLMELGEELPHIKDDILKDMNVSEECLIDICKDLDLPLNEISMNAVILTLSGWKRRNDSNDTLFCTLCSSVLGLWNYYVLKSDLTDDVQNSEKIEDMEKGSGKRKLSGAAIPQAKKSHNFLHPLQGHRYWCPWIIRGNSYNFKDDKGWQAYKTELIEQLAKISGDKASSSAEKYSTPLDSIRRIRTLLQSCERPNKNKTTVIKSE